MAFFECSSPNSRRFDPDRRILIRRGLVFNGDGGSGRIADVAIADGRVERVSGAALDIGGFDTVIEAEGRWVTPGFIDAHSHYDLELGESPGLFEAVRQGVTTVLLGNCMLSTVCSPPDVCLAPFGRADVISGSAAATVRQPLKRWDSPETFRNWLEHQPLGPNVATLLGHSDLRASAMGLNRSTDRTVLPTDHELNAMERTMRDALSVGFAGLSTMSCGSRTQHGGPERQVLPSMLAAKRERTILHEVLRHADRALQVEMDTTSPSQLLFFVSETIRPSISPLRISLLSAAGVGSNLGAHRFTRLVGWLTKWVGGDLRFQVLPLAASSSPWIDMAIDPRDQGLDLSGHGRVHAHLSGQVGDPNTNGGAHAIDMVGTTDVTLVGRQRAGRAVMSAPSQRRYVTTVRSSRSELDLSAALETGHRSDMLRARNSDTMRSVAPPPTEPMQDDSGAIERMLRNQRSQHGRVGSVAVSLDAAAHNAPLCALRMALDAHQRGSERFASVGETVKRLTSDLADWWRIDTGRIRPGDQADVVVINPDALDSAFDQTHRMQRLGNAIPPVANRNCDAVEAVVIRGRTAYTRASGFAPRLGVERSYGRFLAAG